MINKKCFIFFIIVLAVINLLACETQNPEIKATFTISILTDKDFEDVGTSGEVKEDFRKVHFLLEVNNCTNISNRKISIPNFKEVMNTYDIERYWFGKYSASDSPDEDALYTNDIMFLSKGLTEEDIKSIFKGSKISITWDNKKGAEINKTIDLIDIIEFN